MKIAIDGMGGDHAPAEIVKGCVEASKKIEHEIYIIGREDEIQNELKKYTYKEEQIKIVHASDVITMKDAPVKAVRTKTDSSLVKGLNMVKNGEADLLISAGNSGAIMAGGLFILGRIPGIDRPAIATTYPILGKGMSLMVDSGANAECKPTNLLEFATMGSIYMERVFGITKPKVGLVNIGTEESKGTTLLKGAHELLTKSHLNFIGNVEARQVPDGVCDVIVCDGFVGNIILKLTEGLAWSILQLMKKKFTQGLRSKMGALLLSNRLNEMKQEFDYSEYGGAPILGVKGVLLKIHGSSNANAVKNAIIKGIPYVENKVVEVIQDSVLELEEITQSE
ncbi:phosphate acyltransferase PlsX [Sinanaerobacter sp. ZZT-01]|uniref:phosphate acyltransferase PlsX n=1 Tax=Sinanaerobacter sp. ZZT-01 TaxID=3111540 RepID=UPI002D76C301|nr:phosphate acyltransferase PlsX [Sinanaerobacter sp. ZZT-01]WRR92535.1 phosphate acyltransferase PlsX [Sinanaerobacter sp. ZZT-01]